MGKQVRYEDDRRREMVENRKTPLRGLKKWGFSVWGLRVHLYPGNIRQTLEGCA